jgi:hypothetical protein
MRELSGTTDRCHGLLIIYFRGILNYTIFQWNLFFEGLDYHLSFKGERKKVFLLRMAIAIINGYKTFDLELSTADLDMVDLAGLEPAASALRRRRSTADLQARKKREC